MRSTGTTATRALARGYALAHAADGDVAERVGGGRLDGLGAAGGKGGKDDLVELLVPREVHGAADLPELLHKRDVLKHAFEKHEARCCGC